MITGAQLREARELLGWTPSRLAVQVGRGVQAYSIKRAEAGLRTLIDLERVQRCLEAGGIQFGDDGRVTLRDFGGRSSA